MSFFSSSWCEGLAAASDRDTLLTVLLPFLMILENGEINTTAKANLTGEENIFGPDPTDDRTNDLSHANPTLYNIAVKAGLYRKAARQYKCEILHLHIKDRPRLSGSTRITGNETQGDLMHMWVIYFGRQL